MTIHFHRGDLPDGLDLGKRVAIDTETQGLSLVRDGLCLVQLSAGDAFVVPPGRVAQFHGCSDDLELMEVALPSAFSTTLAR